MLAYDIGFTHAHTYIYQYTQNPLQRMVLQAGSILGLTASLCSKAIDVTVHYQKRLAEQKH